jgi:hypothetical protein
MISIRQRRGVILGIIWSFIAWVPFYTEYLSGIRSYIGIPAALGLNLELALNRGDAFIFSLLLGAGLGFFTASLIDFFATGVKIIGLLPSRKKRLLRRGL